MFSGVNLVLALLGALGVLSAYLALVSPGKVRLWSRDRVASSEGLADRVQRWAEQAGLQVTGKEIVRFSAFLALVGGLAGWVLTGSPAGALMGAVVGGYGYIAFLLDRRDKRRRLYRESLPDVAALIAEGMEEGGTIQTGLERAIRFGPPIVRPDLERILAGIRSGKSVKEAAVDVEANVRDYMFSALVQILSFAEEMGHSLQMVKNIAAALREEAEYRARIDAEMTTSRATLYLLLFMPLVVVVVLRMTAPGYADFWRSGTGSVMLFVAFALIMLGYIIGVRIVNSAIGVPEAKIVVSSTETGEKVARWSTS